MGNVSRPAARIMNHFRSEARAQRVSSKVQRPAELRATKWAALYDVLRV